MTLGLGRERGTVAPTVRLRCRDRELGVWYAREVVLTGTPPSIRGRQVRAGDAQVRVCFVSGKHSWRAQDADPR